MFWFFYKRVAQKGVILGSKASAVPLTAENENGYTPNTGRRQMIQFKTYLMGEGWLESTKATTTEMGGGGQEVQSSSYKISHRDVIYSAEYKALSLYNLIFMKYFKYSAKYLKWWHLDLTNVNILPHSLPCHSDIVWLGSNQTTRDEEERTSWRKQYWKLGTT